jgi:hypothetical protein
VTDVEDVLRGIGINEFTVAKTGELAWLHSVHPREGPWRRRRGGGLPRQPDCGLRQNTRRRMRFPPNAWARCRRDAWRNAMLSVLLARC